MYPYYCHSSLFLQLDLDFICVCCTAPYHSQSSIIYLGIECIGLIRKEVGEEWESIISKCNNLTQLRQAAKKDPKLISEVADSIEPVKILLADIVMRLKPFEVYPAITDEEIRALWNSLHLIDPSLNFGERHLWNLTR